MRDNFNAAFESSAEKEEWYGKWNDMMKKRKTIWNYTIINFDFNLAVGRHITFICAMKWPEHDFLRILNTEKSFISAT